MDWLWADKESAQAPHGLGDQMEGSAGCMLQLSALVNSNFKSITQGTQTFMFAHAQAGIFGGLEGLTDRDIEETPMQGAEAAG